MNTDIRIKTTFPHHIKTRKLIKKLGFKGFYGLICLWCYAAVNKPNGCLDGMSPEDIAIAADWDEDPETFVDSLVRCGFLEKTDGGVFALHDWDEHNAYAAHAHLRSEVARQNALKRWQKRIKDMPVACQSHANCMPIACQSDAPTPTPTPTPSPFPTPFPTPFPNSIDSHVSCTQSESDFVPSNSKIIFSEKDMTFLNLEPYIGKWQDAYPAVDVIQELKAMAAWVASQPRTRWKKDWRRFITNWLSREQDKAELRLAKAGSNGRRFLDE
ncbi:MAG: hypothetical protein QW561_05115 [Candidatus Aenigmatarchaeota archaeon]